MPTDQEKPNKNIVTLISNDKRNAIFLQCLLEQYIVFFIPNSKEKVAENERLLKGSSFTILHHCDEEIFDKGYQPENAITLFQADQNTALSKQRLMFSDGFEIFETFIKQLEQAFKSL